jgi:hypothetical protein
LDAFRLGVKEFLPQPLTRQEVEPALARFEERFNGRVSGAEMQSGSAPNFTFYHFLHALDITTLHEGINNERFGAPIQICGGSNGCGSYTSSSQFSHEHLQRPGLLFANCGSSCGNYVYVAFSMMDGHAPPYPNGFVFGYNATNLKTGTVFQFATSDGQTNGSTGGGIWMGGAGPAFGTDSSGSSWIYVTTANGTFDLNTTGGTNAGDSLLKLNPNELTIASYFTPVDQYYRSHDHPTTCPNIGPPSQTPGDIDLGSGGPMLIPDGELSNWPHLSVSGDKEGGLWFVDRTNLGGHDMSCDTSPTPCNCTPATSPNNIQTYWTGTPYSGHYLHTSPAYWEYDRVVPGLNYMYAGPTNAQLTRYPLCADPSATGPIDLFTCVSSPLGSVDLNGNAITFSYGVTPAVSANGASDTDAIVWAIDKRRHG